MSNDIGIIIFTASLLGLIIYAFYLRKDEYIENTKELFLSIICFLFYRKTCDELAKNFEIEKEIFNSNVNNISKLIEKHNLNKNKNAFNKKFFKKYRK